MRRWGPTVPAHSSKVTENDYEQRRRISQMAVEMAGDKKYPIKMVKERHEVGV